MKISSKEFFGGFIGGVIFATIICFAIVPQKNDTHYDYVELKNDWKIEETGFLKKGTILRIDEAMPEGFTRYILYLNLKGDKTKIYKTNHPDEIIPYWLQPRDSTEN